MYERMGRLAKQSVLLFIVAASIAGCGTTGNKQAIGGILGAAGGGLLGAQFGGGQGRVALAALGAVGGLILGSQIGQGLDDVDRLKAHQTTNQALEGNPSGQSSTWRNPDTGHYGSVTPKRTYQRASGDYCRDFTQTVNIGGRAEEVTGTACRDRNGNWRTVS